MRTRCRRSLPRSRRLLPRREAYSWRRSCQRRSVIPAFVKATSHAVRKKRIGSPAGLLNTGALSGFFSPAPSSCSTPKRRFLQMLTGDGPIQHVAKQCKAPIDRRCRERSVLLSVDDSGNGSVWNRLEELGEPRIVSEQIKNCRPVASVGLQNCDQFLNPRACSYRLAWTFISRSCSRRSRPARSLSRSVFVILHVVTRGNSTISSIDQP